MNSSEDYVEEVKRWIRPLQKSLTIESESQFINILGKEKFFNEYLNFSLKDIDKFNFKKDYENKFQDFSKRYENYNSLEKNQRKRLVIDTRKTLFELGKSLDSVLEIKVSQNYQNQQNLLKGTSLNLKSDISKIQGVGKNITYKLNKLGLFNINDLINYFPRTYLDYSCREKIINLRPDNLYTCIANIKRFYMYKSKNKNNLAIMNIIIFDETSSIRVTKFFIGKRFRSYSFFASQKEKFKIGTKIAISGKVKLTEYGRSFVDPQIEIINNKEDYLFYGKILPIYSLSDAITNIHFIKIIRKILPCSVNYPDILSEKQLKSLSLLSLSDALINIHLPRSQSFLDEAKKRLVFNELLLLQLKFILRKKKRRQRNFSRNFLVKKTFLNEFLNNIPFTLTSSQSEVLNEIKEDLMGESPMSRLLQGDVGSGKTIIAIASLLLIVEKGYQGAMMAPTEVLAEQHYKNLIKNLDPLLISVGLLTGNTSPKKRKKLLTDLVNGQINILVGTHALFEDKVIFESLGLVVIDEQHRFGVNQRNRLLKKGENTHLLSMTATPIPRTLALALYGDLDVSQIRELPPGRLPVATEVISDNKLTELFKIVEKEIYKGKQAYVILPLIEDSEKLNLNSAIRIYEYLSNEIYPQFKVGLLHGKLNSEEKNSILDHFEENKINILVSTTVIEVGIDVPNASIMIIYNSERFGLSQLHQLRGRVGRDSYKSHCYLVTSDNNAVSNKRLKVLQNSNDGFFIAERDLDLRGPGQILGYRQSGLPDFVLENLPENKILIDKAKVEAIKIIDCDPKLDSYPSLKSLLLDKSGNKFIHEFLN